MRRLTDVTIQVDGRPSPRQPARKAGRGGARRRWWPPLWLKKYRRVTTGVAACGLVTGIAAWAVFSGAAGRLNQAVRGEATDLSARAGFRVEQITVEGRSRTPREELLGALQVKRGDPMFGIDLIATRQRLEEISWIKTATIERRLPNEVHLSITERAPVVLWQNEGRYYLVDGDGQVVGDEIDEYGGLPLMVGEGAPDHTAQLLELLRAEPDLARRVKAAQWIGDRRWNITLDRTSSGIDVRLPEDDPIGAWHDLAKLDHDQGLLERQVTMIDLRLPDRLVLRTSGGAEESTTAGRPKHKPQPGKDA